MGCPFAVFWRDVPILIAAKAEYAKYTKKEGKPDLAGLPSRRCFFVKRYILAIRTCSVDCPSGALARLGVARAYALSGEMSKSRTAYQDFLSLWKDADPDIPILKQAKAEYAKLQ